MHDSDDSGASGPAQVFLSVGLTAHRDLVPAEEPRLRAQVRSFLQRLQGEFPDLPLRVISALAIGGDQLVAEETLALGIELMVPLPMPQAEYEADFHDAESLARFRGLLARARVRTLPLAPGNDIEAVRGRGEARNRQYAQLGMFVSSHCQVLLALWDGQPSEATGGTAQVIEYHLRNSMRGFNAEDAAPNLLAGLKERSQRQIDVLLNSHHHPDHTGGNGVLRPAAKQIVAHVRSSENQKVQAERAKESEVGKNLKTEGGWRNGLWNETADKAFRYTIGGVIQFDMGWFDAPRSLVDSLGQFNLLTDPGLALQDGMDIRRGRVRMQGSPSWCRLLWRPQALADE